jgi:hypothetical protein
MLLLALLIQAPMRLRLREKYLRLGSTNTRALKYWRHTRFLARLLKQALPEALEELALRSKFSQHILTEEDLGRFSIFRDQTIAQLRGHPWWKQLFYRLILALY